MVCLWHLILTDKNHLTLFHHQFALSFFIITPFSKSTTNYNFRLNNPTSRKVFLYHYLPQLPVKCFFHFVREWSICDRLYPSHRTFASVKPRQAKIHSPKQRQYRNYSWLHRETATKIVCISPTSKIAPTILFPVDKLWFDELLWQPLRNIKVCFIWS